LLAQFLGLFLFSFLIVIGFLSLCLEIAIL
jgi:hypothetical protein